MHFADRVVGRAKEINSGVCVGIDPRYELLPEDVRARSREVAATAADAAAWCYTELAARIIDAVAPYACAIKPQMAFFEALGTPGVAAYEKTLALARDADIPTVADAKRADIGSTSAAYASAFFGGNSIGDTVFEGIGADSLTINPYFGSDGVAPFLSLADERERGVFILVRTSNPSAAEIQDLVVTEGNDPLPVWRRVAALVSGWGASRLGESGYSSVGAVAGATNPETLADARRALPRAILLVPGYGAQGGTAADVANAFDAEGLGALVNASRSIVFAKRDAATLAELADAAAAAARAMRDDINAAITARTS
jgi:orotidine-5'-phosphate decarboxylase